MNQYQLGSLAGQVRPKDEPGRDPATDDPALQKWRVAKRVTWWVLLAAAFLAFYLMDKLNEALSILR